MMPSPLFTTDAEVRSVRQQIKTILLQDGRLMDSILEAMKKNDIYVACRPNPNGSIVVRLHDRVSGKIPKFEPKHDGLYWYLVVPQEGKTAKDIKVLSVDPPAIGEYDYRELVTVIITNCELAEAA